MINPSECHFPDIIACANIWMRTQTPSSLNVSIWDVDEDSAIGKPTPLAYLTQRSGADVPNVFGHRVIDTMILAA
jgi:hypothetical protein